MSNASIPLSAAAADGNTSLVFSLLAAHRSSMSIHQNFKDLALRTAAENGHDQLVMALLKHGARAECFCHPAVIRGAARYGSPETVAVLLREHRLLPWWPWAYKRGKWMTAFLDAAAAGRRDIIRVMLRQGFSADFRFQCADCRGRGRAKNRQQQDSRCCGTCRSESAIQLAAQYGHEDLVALLLALGATVRAEKRGEHTALHRAASQGYARIVRRLLQAGWDANAVDEGKRTPLYEAAIHHHREAFDALLEGGGKIGDHEGEYLPATVISKNSEGLRILLTQLPPSTFARFCGHQDPHGDVLERAIKTGDAASVKLILAYAERHDLLGDMSYTRAFNATYSSLLVSNFNATIIDHLITHCPWPETTRAAHIFFLVHHHAALGHVDAVLMLVEWHYEIGCDETLLGTAMFSAILHAQAETVMGLIEKAGAEVETLLARKLTERNSKGALVVETVIPLHVAVQYGFLGVCKVLISHGADPAARDDKGETALHQAARWGQVEAAALLLDHGAEINATCKAGCTAIHSAACAMTWRSGEMVKYLYEGGGDLNARNNVGRTPLHVAKRWGSAYKSLVSLGADQSIRDEEGLTAEDYIRMSVLGEEKGKIRKGTA